MEELDEGRTDSIVITAVHYLDCQDIQSSDKLASLWKIRDTRLQQDQHDHIYEIMQDLRRGHVTNISSYYDLLA